MFTVGHIEKLYMDGKITEEEYRKKKTQYIERLYEMYVNGLIDEEELKERLNK